MTNDATSTQGLVEQATEVAERAGALTLEHWRHPDLVVDGKVDGTEVTVADREAEHLARELISAWCPEDAILGEEHGETAGTSGRTWIIDPIDGTFGFVRGVPLYSTLVAVVDETGPVAGVIHLPVLGRTIAAGRGLGCFDNGSRSSVSHHATVAGSLVCTSDWQTFDSPRFDAMRDAGAHMRTWGDAYGYAMVATGEAEVMIDPICSAWDLAPMPVIIGEAGGRFTDLAGVVTYDSGNGIASNGLAHDELLTIMRTGR